MNLSKRIINQIASAAVFIITFIVYIVTLAPTIISRDSAELITAAFTLDIPHPPGFPLFILLGKIFSLLPIGAISYRINLMTALFGALTVFVLFWIIIKTTRNTVSAIITSFVFGFSSLFWFWTNSTEVFSLLTLLSAVLIYILISWKNKINLNNVSSFNLLLLFSFIFGLSFGNHHIIVFLIPAFLYLIFSTDKTLFNLKKLLFCFLSFIFGIILIYSFLYIRSHQNLFIDWGNPETITNLINVFLRKDFGTIALNENFTVPWSFSTFFSHLFFNISNLFRQFTFFGIIISAFGIYFLFKTQRQLFYFFTLAYLFSSLGISLLLGNMGANSNILFVSERFYLLSFFIFSFFLAFGISFLFEKAKIFKNNFPILVALLLLLIALPSYNLISNFSRNDKSNDFMDYDKISNILSSVEENAIILTQDDNIIFGVWYFQQVENSRKDVKMILPSSSPNINQDSRERYPELFTPKSLLTDHFMLNLMDYYFDKSTGREIIKEVITNNIKTAPIYLIEMPDTENLLSDYLISNSLLRKISLKPNPNTYETMSVSHQNLWEKYQYRNKLQNTEDTRQMQYEIITQYAFAHNFLALSYMSQGYYAEAAAELEISNLILPNNQDTIGLQNLLTTLSQKEKLKDTIDDPEFKFDLGVLYLAAKRYELAEKEFSLAIEGGIDTDVANLNLGVALLKQEKTGEAKKSFEKSVAINPNNYYAQGYLDFIKTFD